MAEAELTKRVFYAHFRSKDDFVGQALEHALVDREEALRSLLAAGGLEAMLHTCLSEQHRDNQGLGWASAAYAARLLPFIDTVAATLPRTGEHGRRIALAIYALLIGALQTARAVSDPALSDAIFEGGILGQPVRTATGAYNGAL